MSSRLEAGRYGATTSENAASRRRGLSWTRRDVVFGASVALLLAHAAVDSLIAPEPGTGAQQHLVRAVATTAVLVASALLFPRLPAGGRAAVEAVLGVLALEAAALAIADAQAGGPRGEDWTGLLLLPAGLALVGTAAATLWRSRKPRGRRHLRRVGIGVAALLVGYWLVLPFGVAIFATHRPRADVQPADLGRAYEQVTLRTSEGLALAAWYIPSRNGAAVISYPTREGTVAQARMLARHGYGVLLVDAQGYDGSEGDPNAFGWNGTEDIDAAIDWLGRRPDVSGGRIGGIGLSVGGEVMLEAAATNPSLRAVVSEGAGVRSVREHLLRGPQGWFSLPEAAVQTAALAAMTGTSPPRSLTDLLPRIAPRPLLLIYAGHGGGGEELSPTYFDAARQPKSLWKIPEARHLGGIEARPAQYESRVVGFFDRALLGAPAHDR
jgi:hypothetical protein